ncbi:MAG: GIY-YIG nuclease family protein [Elusimicrobia bacterium]|nr:GIY-YIG nuclease family protein [Candidatus Liberimonas magnetica]
MWHVYILECKNLSLYTGITDNLKRRIKQHKEGKGSKYTRSFGVKKLLYEEKHPTKSSALKREAEIKSFEREEKLALINRKECNC